MREEYQSLTQEAINLATSVAQKYRHMQETRFLDRFNEGQRLFRFQKAQSKFVFFDEDLDLNEIITSIEERSTDSKKTDTFINSIFTIGYYEDAQYEIIPEIPRIKERESLWQLRDGRTIRALSPGKPYIIEVWPHALDNITVNVTYFVPYQNQNSIDIRYNGTNITDIQGYYKVNESRNEKRELQEKDKRTFKEILKNVTPWIKEITKE